jgi:hypothetical protein
MGGPIHLSRVEGPGWVVLRGGVGYVKIAFSSSGGEDNVMFSLISSGKYRVSYDLLLEI